MSTLAEIWEDTLLSIALNDIEHLIETLSKVLNSSKFKKNYDFRMKFTDSLMSDAANRDNEEILKLLLEFFIFNDNEKSLIIAIFEGNIRSVESLLKEGVEIVNITEVGVISLAWCAFKMRHRKEILPLLFEYRQLNADFRNGNRENLLHIFAENHLDENDDDNATEFSEILLKFGVSANELDREGFSPLHRFVSVQNFQLISLIINKGADPNQKNESGETPFLEAVAIDHLDIVDLFLQNGADINARSSCGSTSLHIACGYLSDQMVSLLIRAFCKCQCARQ